MSGLPPILGVAVLVGMRVSGLVLIAPVFSGRTIPRAVRVGLILTLTAFLVPTVTTLATPTLTAMASELLVGFVVGFGAAVVVAGAQFAGDLLAIQIGLSGASTLDPLNQTTMPVLGQFTQLFMVMLLLGMNGHLLMLRAVTESYAVVPAGAPVDLTAGLPHVLAIGGLLFGRGLQFAAPVIAAVTLANAGLGILARTVPQLNVLMVAFPIQIGIGLATLGVALPFIATAQSDWVPGYTAWLQTALAGLAGGG